ncbi:hypothetical protein [Salibacter halophilus]|uniref:DUF4129 domain-containing protein n=1 Tax=Salibacter halophilus TaxID=1803916 RepID=A0A6N6MA23_9FLAO|nr:hypothetical protein [Salibacter halophilus]KAB1065100.1 hypothetical protein F3059_03885 [Salibacter halophilus]
MKKLLLLLMILLVPPFYGMSQSDSLKLDREEWEEQSKDYSYSEMKDEEPKEEKTQTNQQTNWNIDTEFWRAILFGVIITGIVILILVIIKNSPKSDRVKDERIQATSIEDAEENLPDVTLDNIYQKALDEKDFRSALHIKFLMVLQQMVDNHYITWKKRKTNEQYINEINEWEVRDTFANLVQIYDEVWYGQKDLTNDVFELAINRIDKLNTKINSHEEG